MSSGSRPRRAPPPRSGPDHAEVLTRATQPGSCGVTVTDDDLLSYGLPDDGVAQRLDALPGVAPVRPTAQVIELPRRSK
jgi:hypothetical protein